MIHLELLGVHTRLGSSLCASCPHGYAGCCVGPPDMGWSDIGRIVTLGGRDWLLGEIAARRLTPTTRVNGGLEIKRVRKREGPLTARVVKCIYHGAQGCTISPDRRMAVCNYYLCQSAYDDGGEPKGEPAAVLARKTHSGLMDLYARWDTELSALVAEMQGVGLDGGLDGGAGGMWSAAFLDWLGEEFAARARST